MAGSSFQTFDQQLCNAFALKLAAPSEMNNCRPILCNSFRHSIEKIASNGVVRCDCRKNHLLPGMILECAFGKWAKCCFACSVQLYYCLKKWRIQTNFLNSEL